MSTGLIILIVVFFILIFLGIPTYLSLLVSSLCYFFMHPEINAIMVMQKMFSSLDNFVLVAIPLFTLAGNVMNSGGITDRLFTFCLRLVGHLRGGLGYVNVAASFIFSGMSGSALADIGGLGQIELKAMKDQGYDDEFSLGITAASATMGPIIPPSIPMVVYGGFASISVGALFLGGMLPGILIGVLLCVAIAILAKKRNYPVSKKATLWEVLSATKSSIFALLMPVALLGGLWSGFFTPTEVAMIAIIYSLIVILFVYREMKFKDFLRCMKVSLEAITPAMGIIIASCLFGWVLQFEHLNSKLLEGMNTLTNSKYVVLLVINIIILIFGMFLDATPIIMMFAPALVPIGQAYGINPIHMGVVVVFNLMIGLITPPIGGSLFILCSVTQRKFEFIVRSVVPWLVPLIIALIFVTYIPDLVLFVPRLAGIIQD
jgi:tripartite ATP-independent transporter DctM subunit